MTAPEYSGGRSHLEKQADELLEEGIDAVDLLRELDFGFLKHNDTYAEWHASTPLKPMVRALLLKELEGYSFSELHGTLTTNPQTADALGFEEVPSRTTFGRAWRDRLTTTSQTTWRRTPNESVVWRTSVAVQSD